MDKLYYDDEYAAAYMHKHFKVGYTGKKDGKIYIHPEYYSLFKIKPGDMVETHYDDGDIHAFIAHKTPGFRMMLIDDLAEDEVSNEIIRRNNKHFFMPESEVA